MKSPRPQGAGQRQSFLLRGGEASTKGSPGLGKDIPSTDSLFGRPASIGNVAAKVPSIMDDANALLLEMRAKGGRRGPPMGLVRIHGKVQDLGKLLHQKKAST